MELYLLGTFDARGDDGEELNFRSERERALLAYLAVEADGSHRRDAIATLFWPDTDEKQSRNNLRVTLHRLRQALGSVNGGTELLQVSRNELQFVPDDDVFVDFRALTAVIEKTNKHDHTRRHHCAVCIEELEGIVPYYRGEFLKGFSLKDSELFAEWVRTRQQRLHSQILHALHDLAAFHLENGNFSQARHFANRQLELEPWREEAHRQLMAILASSGERTAALNQYEICCTLLEKELGIDPSEETVALYEQIRRGESLEVEPKQSAAPLPEMTALPLKDGPVMVSERPQMAAKRPHLEAKRGLLPGFNLIGLVVGLLLLAVVGWMVWGLFFGRVDIYDDFNGSTADGHPDGNRWLFPHQGPDELCNFVQQDGVLKFIPDDGSMTGGCALRVAPPEFVEGAQLERLSARMRYVTGAEGDGLAVGLRVSSSFENGDWNVDCGLVTDGEMSKLEMVVSDTRIGQILYSASREITPDVWYLVGLTIDAETLAATCHLDGDEIGHYAPEFADRLLEAPFVREILVQQSAAVSSEIWIDDFQKEL